MSSSSTHYALVKAGSSPLPLPHDDDPDPARDPRSELTDLYQHYADLYPNPRLVEEAQLRDTLLQAASAAVNARSSRMMNSKTKSGFFARLFGGANDDDDDNNNNNKKKKNDKGNDTQQPTPAAPLVYTDLPNEHDDGGLCGTMQSIDVSCIPVEAYSVARFHLASTRTRRDHPNATSWGPPQTNRRPVSISLIVVGLGVIFQMAPEAPSKPLPTSDRDDLLHYAQAHPGEFQLHNVRATAISPNCLAVSWGFLDGLIVIYRRIQYPEFEGWEQLWMVGPSRPVLEAIADVFHDDETHPRSPLLRVTDISPLRVETGDEGQPMVASLALARLGGYIELLPLPTKLWFGPLLTPQNHQRKKQPKRRRGHHYAMGKSIGSPPLALTTVDYHMDITCLQALRTRVEGATEWNSQAYPDTPPSEFVLCASGMSAAQEGCEAVTFWSVSTLFSENSEGGMDFQLHSSLLEAITVPTGADVSIFATPEIMQRWRTPRHVELRPDAAITGTDEDYSNTTGSHHITTVSITAPIVSMHFCQYDETTGPVLALLDWNGSVTLLDCSLMERVASQQLSTEEYEDYRTASDQETPFPLATSVVSRAQFAKALGRRQDDKVGNLHWLGGETHGTLPPLVLLLRDARKLVVLTFSSSDESDDGASPKSSLISLAFPGRGAALGDLGSGNLSFVSRRNGTKGPMLKYFVMQQLQPVAIIQSLARESKFEEAIQAATKLSDHDQEALSEVMEDCRRQLWETRRDVDSLADTRSVSYTVDEALSLCHSVDADERLTLESFRLVCKLAIRMGQNYSPSKDKLDEIRGVLVKLGTYELLCQYFSVEASLSKFRNTVQNVPVAKLAKSLAQRGDMMALSVVLFRHRREVGGDILGILGSIPLSVNPEVYVHLVPLIKEGEMTDSFFHLHMTIT